MGLSPYPLISLSEARDKAMAQRRLLLDGIDPIVARDAKQPARSGHFCCRSKAIHRGA